MDQIPRYIANKQDPEHAVYTHPALKPILEVTYGCMVYQEQVMQIVRDLAGYSLGRADLVRRAMGKKKLDVMAKEREYFIHGQTDENGNIVIPGCVRNGIDEKSANTIFDEMAEFAKYAFNKSHAAAYAVVSYRTAYLKAYYKEEFMAATLNSFLGNLDKVPLYIEECKKMGIEILKPDINKSFTKFTVDSGKIRFGLGSIKNVGNAVIDSIVNNREQNGPFKDFADFCERMQESSVNKKCIESLIKAGVFDEFEQTRSTLMASYEDIVDSISNSNKKGLKGQVTMFDLAFGNDEKAEDDMDNQLDSLKYNYTVLKEFSDKELLAMEKEMLGLYISGHPLESFRDAIEKESTINTLKMKEIQNTESAETVEIQDKPKYRDGQMVRLVGIVESVKKKYTKTNKIMAFTTLEDLYGQCEIIIFENCYQMCSNILLEGSIVLIEGRLSIREDEDVKIVANRIIEFKGESHEHKSNVVTIDITNLSEEQKDKLRGAIRFFAGDRNNCRIDIKNGERVDSAGGVLMNDEIYKEFQDIVGENNIKR
jgi:DNA polymerase-3 subunit alpha